ncbi:hypothetical protein [Bacillus pseudomycoides]|uniref:hypothetical protein n=1 Tax=Bacillus pseudomycoides TaxID=64104 RepID=UPI003CF54611
MKKIMIGVTSLVFTIILLSGLNNPSNESQNVQQVANSTSKDNIQMKSHGDSW